MKSDKFKPSAEEEDYILEQLQSSQGSQPISQKAREAGLTDEDVSRAEDFIRDWRTKDPAYVYEANEARQAVEAVKAGNFIKAENIADGMDGELYKMVIFNNLREIIGAGVAKFHPARWKKTLRENIAYAEKNKEWLFSSPESYKSYVDESKERLNALRRAPPKRQRSSPR